MSLCQFYVNELTDNDLKEPKNLVKWRYIDGSNKISATCKWLAKAFHERSVPSEVIFSPTFTVGDNEELIFEIQLCYHSIYKYFYARLNFFGLKNKFITYDFSLSLLHESVELQECKKFNVTPLTVTHSPSAELKFNYTKYLTRGKTILTLVVGIVAEIRTMQIIESQMELLELDDELPLELRDLDRLLREAPYSDVTLVVGDEKIAAHRNILAVRSPVFHDKFAANSEQQSGSSNVEVEIEDVNCNAVKEMLRFMYTGQFRDLGEEHVKQMLLAANKFAVDSMIPKCEDVLCKYLTIDNAIEILKLADSCSGGAEKIKSRAIEILINNTDKVDEKYLSTLKSDLLAKILLGAVSRCKKKAF